MKNIKIPGVVLAVAMIAAIVLPGLVLAGSVGDRAFFSGGTNCIGRWTNTTPQSAVQLTKMRVQRSLTATNVVTFYRITGDDTNNVFTNAIGAVTCASGVGVQGTLTAEILKYGDIVESRGWDAATGAASNTYTSFIEYNVQQH